MPLYIHLSIHFFLALLTGYMVGKYYRQPIIGLLAGLAGGFLIDLDHALEYFIVFGWQFDLAKFFMGYQFLASGLIRLWFHAWEYIPILIILAWFFRHNFVVKTIILALVWSGSVHLVSDVFINNYPVGNYSWLYRYRQGFRVENLLNEVQYQQYQADRIIYGF